MNLFRTIVDEDTEPEAWSDMAEEIRAVTQDDQGTIYMAAGGRVSRASGATASRCCFLVCLYYFCDAAAASTRPWPKNDVRPLSP